MVKMLKEAFSKIISNPECQRDEARYAVEVRESFFDRKKYADSLILLYQLGIMDKIRNCDFITRNLYYEFRESLTENYAIPNEIAEKTILLWFSIYGKEMLHKRCEVDTSVVEREETSAKVFKEKHDVLIGQTVMLTQTKQKGIISEVSGDVVSVDFHGAVSKFLFPDAFSGILKLKNKGLQSDYETKGSSFSFDAFKRKYISALVDEIQFLYQTGGKKYRIIDGEQMPSKRSYYIYSFDTDVELHLPEGTAIKLWFPDRIIPAYIIGCEEFTIILGQSFFLCDTLAADPAA